MKKRQPMTRFVRPLRSGQITIPVEFRKRLGITEDTVLQVILQGSELRLKPVQVKETAEGSPWFNDLYELFVPTREEAAAMSAEEVDDSIRQAVAAVRKKGA